MFSRENGLNLGHFEAAHSLLQPHVCACVLLSRLQERQPVIH